MIRLDSISKKLGDVKVLEKLSFSIEKNEILAVIGPSGCGKTTLLRLIAGLEVLDSGRIIIDGIEVDGNGPPLPPRLRRVAMIFQELALWPHMTASQHLVYVLKRCHQPRAHRRRKARQLLEVVDLADRGHRYPHQLSGGEQQRLAIVRALAQSPDYLLLDEPFSHLDPILKRELETVLAEIRPHSNLGMVYVTHNIQDIKRIVQRVAILQKGRLIQIGEKETVFRRPATPFVKEMIEG